MIREINGELVIVEENAAGIPVFRDYPEDSALLIIANLTNLEINFTPNFITNRYVNSSNGEYVYIIKSNTVYTVEIKTPNSNLSKISIPPLEPRAYRQYRVKSQEDTLKEFSIEENLNISEELRRRIVDTRAKFKLSDNTGLLVFITDLLDIRVDSNLSRPTYLFKDTLGGKNIIFFVREDLTRQLIYLEHRGYKRATRRIQNQIDLIFEVK